MTPSPMHHSVHIMYFSIFFLAALLPPVASATFADVPLVHPYLRAIDYVQSQGIVSGYPDGTYQPHNAINRAEFTKIVVGARFSPAETDACLKAAVKPIFSDVRGDEWFAKYICKAKAVGIVSGNPDGTFRPGNAVNYVEAAKIVIGAYGFRVVPGKPWYAPYHQKLSDLDGIPPSIVSMTHVVNRGEMAEMIYRLRNTPGGPPPSPSPSTLSIIPSFSLLAGDYTFSFHHGGLERTYLLHVPPSYNIYPMLPVILNFHGGGHNAEGMIEQSGMNKGANKNGYIAVYPNGTAEPGRKNLTWNSGDCCGYAMKNNIDDVGFTKKIILDLSSKFNIDTRRIYATGYSNGGSMAYRLAREIPDVIAAIAPMAVTPSTEPISQAVPVLHFHGEQDPCAKFDGGECGGCFGSVTRACSAVFPSFQALAQLYQCNPNPQVDTSREDVTCTTYSNCSNNSQAKLCSIRNAGHVWPGSSDNPLTPRMIGPDTFALDANEEMWSFFQMYSQ